MMITHWEKVYLYSCMTIITVGCLVLSYWYFIPDRVVVVENPESISVDREVYQAGDTLIYSFDYCKKREIAGIVNKFIVDGNSLPLGEKDGRASLEVGCHTKKVAVKIPEYFTDDIYHLVIVGEYQVNPIQKLFVSLRTVDFKVENTVLNKIEEHDAEDQEKFKSLQNQINRID